ncbi:glycosyltransferase [Kineococcus indalonis]|uniref:glycosyltransferase n=1 Tax=Kineococcus indalonis TaxID=2696566 RepID=UPI00141363F7|nr:glycosyltransferase [Kineococcus indalonis]NAZ86379.1 glycosyltransferase [Kineococcus indalonis]
MANPQLDAPPARPPRTPAGPRTAVVHEWVAARAGAEQVFEALAATWPEADLYALSRAPGVPLELGGRTVRTTALDHPLTRDRRAATLPLMPLAWRALGRGQGYDLVVTSHHAFATANRLVRPGGAHLAYVHSPARYVWSPELDGRGASPLLAPARRLLAGVDRRAAARLTAVAANSAEVARRVERFWGREATVVHPPVDVERFAGPAGPDLLDLPEGYLLALGRFVPYKNHALVVDVAERLRRPAVLAGAGPLAGALRRRAEAASVPVLVLEAPGPAAVGELLRRAGALLFPAVEDFGIVPVEAMAAGTPVVAPDRGGAAETVLDGVTGALVAEQRADAYARAVARAEACSPGACRQRAREFGPDRFRERLTAWVAEHAPGAAS